MVSETIGQRQLRNDSGAVMRRVEQGESFVVTRNGRPIADLVPHAEARDDHRLTLAEVHEAFRSLPPMNSAEWRAERDAADELFGDDDPSR